MFLNAQGEICFRRYGADSILPDEGRPKSLSRRVCRNTENSLISESRACCRKARERGSGGGRATPKNLQICQCRKCNS